MDTWANSVDPDEKFDLSIGSSLFARLLKHYLGNPFKTYK